MNRTKAFVILGIIVLSLIPVYLLYKYLQRVMRPRASMRRFLLWMLVIFIVIFAYTFSIVLLIKLIFPGA